MGLVIRERRAKPKSFSSCFYGFRSVFAQLRTAQTHNGLIDKEIDEYSAKLS